MTIYTRTCLICQTEFTQAGQRGNLRRMCSEACSRQRIRNKRNGRYKERYGALKKAGATGRYAAWAARASNLRFEAVLEVLEEEKSGAL